jgi:hypothetical protein
MVAATNGRLIRKIARQLPRSISRSLSPRRTRRLLYNALCEQPATEAENLIPPRHAIGAAGFARRHCHMPVMIAPHLDTVIVKLRRDAQQGWGRDIGDEWF